tara:strand:- start:215 stop:583 length:369 start_codon:yes stop_codon:yes gene_type:complete
MIYTDFDMMKSIVSKPWGSFQVIEEGDKYTLKRLVVKKGGKLSLQSHNHRSEHWVVVQGEAEVTLGDKNLRLQENENIYIPVKTKHCLANKKEKELIIIEVWFGDTLEEEDIIRYQDIYDRK